MPNTAAAIHLAGRDEQTLRRWMRSSSIRAGFARRARIVLAAAEGLSNTQIAERGPLLAADGDPLAWSLRRHGAGRPGGPAPLGPAPHCPP